VFIELVNECRRRTGSEHQTQGLRELRHRLGQLGRHSCFFCPCAISLSSSTTALAVANHADPVRQSPRLFDVVGCRMMVTHWALGRRRCSTYRGASTSQRRGVHKDKTRGSCAMLWRSGRPLHPTAKHGSDCLFCHNDSCRRIFSIAAS